MFPIYIIFFLLGDLYLQTFSQLPSFTTEMLAVVFILSFFIFKKIRIVLIISLFFLFGFSYTHWFAYRSLSWTLPAEIENKPIVISGRILSIPEKKQWGQTFLFSLQRINAQPLVSHQTIQLNWPKIDINLHQGEEYQITVKLKRIHGLQNPGGFDYEAWALQNGIRAKGNVMQKKPYRRLDKNKLTCFSGLRNYMYDQIMPTLPNTPTAAWLPALMIGIHDKVNPKDWQVLRNTGTNHLMAIAGLHIGAISGLTFFLVNWLWRRSYRLMLSLPASYAACIAALFISVFYSFLAGFSLPTQRACLMFAVLTYAFCSQKKISTWHIMGFALLIVLLVNPLCVLAVSFWLSFGTIGLIHYGMSHRYAPNGIWWKWGRVQWVVGLGLLPISLILFQQSSLSSFIANSIAIPWLTFLIMPFCFLALVSVWLSSDITHYLLSAADFSLSGLWFILTQLAGLKLSVWEHTVPNFSAGVFALLGMFILLSPKGTVGKFFGLFLFAPLLLPHSSVPKIGEFRVTFLDVGQGLSVVVQTHTRTLIYDTGPNLGSSDTGERVILPFLIHENINKLDKLVISHPDNDHIGGAKTILSRFPNLKLTASSTKKLESYKINFCEAGDNWTWDGVEFIFLHPDRTDHLKGNDRSCVLLIKNGKYSLLLTGDIEKAGEEALLRRHPRVHATAISAPHHGSKTSSHLGFIQSIKPQLVIYASGYKNQFHFPHVQVVKNYAHHHISQLNTAETGAITLDFSQSGMNWKLYRKSHEHYWFNHL